VTELEARSRIAERVSRETLARLDVYADLLRKWQKRINLVAPATLDALWQRHFLDSLQVLDASPIREGLWLDLGSGGGFPGLVCAIAALETDPALRFELVDSDTRKCVFLREVARHTGLSVTVHTSRIEALPPRNASVISARALAPLSQLLPLALRHLAPGGICLFQKGAGHGEELESLPEGWQMEVDILPSVTSADSVILRIRNLSHAA
jgi:16S rRNA (guanine527-N7)-methyltransferase